MLKTNDLYWIAGLIEGEGSFCWRGGRTHTPVIQIKMTDFDVIEKASKILNRTPTGPYNNGLKCKDYLVLDVVGRKAVGWMLTLYPLMGKRRQEKIKELIARWKLKPFLGANQYLKQYAGRNSRTEPCTRQ